MAPTRELGSLRHLAGRFVGALWPGGPSAADEAWARGWLAEGERTLWARMSGPDRRHAVGVARGTQALLPGGGADRAVMASALLHDVGKVESGLGTLARAAVTGVALVVGRRRLAGPGDDTTRGATETADAAGRRGGEVAPAGGPVWRRRVQLYFHHDRIGGQLLRSAGSDPGTVAWAEQHHLPPERWTVDPAVGRALKAADGD